LFKKIVDYLKGPNIYLFTNLNPFKLSLLLEKSKVITTAKSGDVAAFDVVVRAENTGQPPGPIISQLNAVGLPTRIESGSVWITKDSLVAKKGEIISEGLAAVLSKLGVKCVEAGLNLKVAYDEGVIIRNSQLQIDLEEIKEKFRHAHFVAMTLSLSVNYPTKENIISILRIAHGKASSLALKAVVYSRETIKDLIMRAHFEILSLSSSLHLLKESVESSKEVKK
jgi:large subunit ribosomal protein L10